MRNSAREAGMKDLRVLSAGLALLLVPAICSGRFSKLAKDLEGLDPESTIDVIVQFAHSAGNEGHEKVNRRGGRLKAELPAVAGALYSMQVGAAADLAKDPDVIYISPDREVRAMLEYANPTLSVPLALQYGLEGSGIGIAVIDSGILEVRDLQGESISGSRLSRVVYSQSFVPKVSDYCQFAVRWQLAN
jgi:serine protease AprX